MKRYILIVFALVMAFCMAVGAVEDAPTEDSAPVEIPIESYSETKVYSLDDFPALGDESALKGIIASLFGEYTPRTHTVTVYLPDGSTVESVEIIPGIAGIDWYWVSGVVLFALVLLCLFKALGGVLTRG